MKPIIIKITKEQLLKIDKGARRKAMLDIPMKKNQAFKDKKKYTRKKKHKKTKEK
jgi:hypothetical protein